MRSGFFAAAASSGSGAGAPGVVTNVTGTRGIGKSAITWSAPVSNGGSPITDYTVQYSSDSGSNWATFVRGASTNAFTTVTGLSTGTSYIYRVLAINAIGSGPYSAASAAVTTATVPFAPTSVVGTQGVGQISLTWVASATDSGSPTTDYTVQYSSDSGANWTTFADGVSFARSATVTGLASNTSYVFRVAATNLVGTGSYSTASAAVSTAAVPGAPSALSVTTHQNTQVPLTWTAPANNGGSAVTDYVVEYSTSATFVGGGTVFADGTSASTSATITGLSNGTSYYFRVAATNAVGTGSYSDISTAATPSVAPSVAIASTTNYNQNSAVLRGTVDTSQGRSISAVEFQYSTSSSFASGNSAWFTASTNSTVASGQASTTCTYNATGLTASVTGTPSTYYVRFRVTDSNAAVTTSSIGGSFNTYRERTDVFTSSGTWTNPVPTSGTSGLAIETLTRLLVVGGGGPGNACGGAGGTLTGFNNVYIPGLTTLAVTIGAGGGVYLPSGSPTSIGSYSASGGQTGGSFSSTSRGGDGNGYLGGGRNAGLGSSSPYGGGAGAGGNGGDAQGYVGGNGGPAVYGLAGGGGGGTSLFADPVTYLGSPSGVGPANTGQGGGGYDRATGFLHPGGSGYADIKYWGPY